MTGFLMVRIIRPCIKRAQQRTLDACVLNKNHALLSESFRIEFRGLCSILPRTFSTTSSVSVDVLPVGFAFFTSPVCR
jgi:hypothetical protein